MNEPVSPPPADGFSTAGPDVIAPGEGELIVNLEGFEGPLDLLLHLCQKNSLTDCMHRPRRNEKTVTGGHFHAMQTLFDASLRQSRTQGGFIDARIQTSVNAASRLGCQNDPGFRLAALVGNKSTRLVVVGMHLYRQAVVSVEVLQEQRKLR
jgi:hypothetical protein